MHTFCSPLVVRVKTNGDELLLQSPSQPSSLRSKLEGADDYRTRSQSLFQKMDTCFFSKPVRRVGTLLKQTHH